MSTLPAPNTIVTAVTLVTRDAGGRLQGLLAGSDADGLDEGDTGHCIADLSVGRNGNRSRCPELNELP